MILVSFEVGLWLKVGIFAGESEIFRGEKNKRKELRVCFRAEVVGMGVTRGGMGVTLWRKGSCAGGGDAKGNIRCGNTT